MNNKQYAERDIMGLDQAGDYYCRHVQAMTAEGLHEKSDIAAELAWRDLVIDTLKKKIEAQENAEPRWNTNNKLLELLERSLAGLEWWCSEHPESASEADFEHIGECKVVCADAAIASLQAAPVQQAVPDVATEKMLEAGEISLRRGIKLFSNNYTQIVNNMWEDMVAASPETGGWHVPKAVPEGVTDDLQDRLLTAASFKDSNGADLVSVDKVLRILTAAPEQEESE